MRQKYPQKYCKNWGNRNGCRFLVRENALCWGGGKSPALVNTDLPSSLPLSNWGFFECSRLQIIAKYLVRNLGFVMRDQKERNKDAQLQCVRAARMTLSCAQWANVTGLDYALHNLYLPSPPGCLVSTKNLWARSTRPFPSTCRCWRRGRQRYRGSLSRRTPTNKLRSQSTVKKLRRQWTKSFRLVFSLQNLD